MTSNDGTTTHGLELGVQVVKADTGKVISYVNEAALLPLGWETDEEGAVRRYCERMEAKRLEEGEHHLPSWLNTEVVVYRDTDERMG